MQHGLGIIPVVPDDLELLFAMLGLAGGIGYVLLARWRAHRLAVGRLGSPSKIGVRWWLNSRSLIAALLILVGLYYLLRAVAYYTSVEAWAADLIKFGILGIGIALLLFALNRKLRAQRSQNGVLRILGVVEDSLLVVALLMVLGGAAFTYIQIAPATYNCVVIPPSISASIDTDAVDYNNIACQYIAFALTTTSLADVDAVLADGPIALPDVANKPYRGTVCPEALSTPTQTSAPLSSAANARPPGNYGDHVPLSLRERLLSHGDRYLDAVGSASKPIIEEARSSNQTAYDHIVADLSALGACEELTVVIKDADQK